MLAEGADGLTEDTRFNRPAKDGEEYTEEGIYTITAENLYTGRITEKKIYVGTNQILKAYMATGLTIQEIKDLAARGAEIGEDGTIRLGQIMQTTETEEVIGQAEPAKTAAVQGDGDLPEEPEDAEESTHRSGKIIIFIIVVLIVSVLVGCGSRQKKKLPKTAGQQSAARSAQQNTIMGSDESKKEEQQ